MTAALSLGSSPVLARSVGAVGRGDVAAVLVVFTVLSWACFLGIPSSAGFHATGRRTSSMTTFCLLAAVAGSVFGTGLWFLSPFLTSGHPPEVITGLHLAALLLPLVGVAQCGMETLLARGLIRRWNVLRSIPVAGAAIGVIALHFGDRLTVATAIAANLVAVSLWIILGSVFAIRLMAPRPLLRGARPLLAYGTNAYVSTLALALFGRLDQILMVPFAKSSELGRYAVAVTIVATVNVIPAAIGTVAYPKARQSNPLQAAAHLDASRRRVLLIGLVLNLGTVLTAPFVVPLVFGPDFGGMALVYVVLAAGQILNDLWMLTVSVINGVGKPRAVIVPSWSGTVVTVAVLLVFAVGRDITALDAALATLVGAAVRTVVLRWSSGPAGAIVGET